MIYTTIMEHVEILKVIVSITNETNSVEPLDIDMNFIL